MLDLGSGAGFDAVAATLVGRDPTTDIAVLRAEPHGNAVATVAGAQDLRPGALALAGSIVGGADVRRGQVDVGGGRIDVVVAHQRLHHGQVDVGLAAVCAMQC